MYGTRHTAENLAAAEEEDNRRASLTIRHTTAVEKVHYGLVNEALTVAEGGEHFSHRPIRVCPVFGHRVFGDAVDERQVFWAECSRFS
jgi:hypothetical protein